MISGASLTDDVQLSNQRLICIFMASLAKFADRAGIPPFSPDINNAYNCKQKCRTASQTKPFVLGRNNFPAGVGPHPSLSRKSLLDIKISAQHLKSEEIHSYFAVSYHKCIRNITLRAFTCANTVQFRTDAHTIPLSCQRFIQKMLFPVGRAGRRGLLSSGSGCYDNEIPIQHQYLRPLLVCSRFQQNGTCCPE
jgi:hypothetical protein